MRLLIPLVVVGLIVSLRAHRLGETLVPNAGKLAMAENDLPGLRAQLRCGMAVNAADTVGVTPLMAAAQLGRAEMSRMLIRYGASVNGRCTRGMTPLAYAAHSGDGATVSTLLQLGADVRIPDMAGNTPLFWAAMSGNLAKVETLAVAGADLRARNRAGWTAADAARAYGHSELADLLGR